MVPRERDLHISAASASSLASTRVNSLSLRTAPRRPGCAENSYKSISAASAFVLLAISLSACSQTSADNKLSEMSGRSSLSSLRTKADPSVVARIMEEEKKQAQAQDQAAIYAETAGPEQVQPGLGRNLPKVSTDPFTRSLIAPPAESVSANGSLIASNNAPHPAANPGAQLATYESAYTSVPPPPPGALGAGLVPPPPAVTLSTQAQAVADTATAFYNNPYFNPFGVPAPPQASMPSRRPAGLFGEGGQSAQYDNSNNSRQKQRPDFVPITPKGMEARSPYKQRDDFRLLWKGALKNSADIATLAENTKLIEQLGHSEIGLPAESTKGSFNISARQVEALFKSSTIDKRALPEVRKLQSDLVQSYYRYLSAYNKYALIEQTVAARKQEVDLSDSDAEKQRAAADLAQSQNDLEASKEDLHSAEIELAVFSSPASARSVISRVAGIAPSVESLAQGASQSSSRTTAHTNKISNIFEVFKRQHSSTEAQSSDLTENPDVADNNAAQKKTASQKVIASQNKESKSKLSLFSRLKPHSQSDDEASDASNAKDHNKSANSDDLEASSNPAPASKAIVSESVPHREHNTAPSNINFLLKNVAVNPRKSILTVAVKNTGAESFELNPDAIYIAEGSRKLGAAALRADFDNTSIEPNQEVKGTITIFSRPWNDKLVIYLADGNKTVQLKR